MTYPDATQGTTSFNALEAQVAVFGTITGSSFDVVYDEESYVTGTSGTFGNIQATNSAVLKQVSWNGTATGTQADLTTANVKNLNGSTCTGSIATLKQMDGSIVSGTQATLKAVIGSTITGTTVTVLHAAVSGTITGTQADITTANVKALNGSTVTGSEFDCPSIAGSIVSATQATIKETIGSTIAGSSVTTPLVTGSTITGSQITVPLVTGSTQTGSISTIKQVVASTISGSSLTLPAGMPGLVEIVAGTSSGTAGVASEHNHTLGVTPSGIWVQPLNDSGTATVTLTAKGTSTFGVKGEIADVAFSALVVK